MLQGPGKIVFFFMFFLAAYCAPCGNNGPTLQAERGYRQGLLMYPKNPAMLRSYAQFMQDIKLNPHASMRYYVEADKLDAQQTEVCTPCC